MAQINEKKDYIIMTPVPGDAVFVRNCSEGPKRKPRIIISHGPVSFEEESEGACMAIL